MRILYCRCFGLGNAVMSVPAIKAISDRHVVDVLVGSTRDDPGALDVMIELRSTSDYVNEVYVDRAPMDVEYDVAVLAIPFDGRWQNGVHFRARDVLDGRPRPGNVQELGIHMWKRHEVEYQMDNAILLGYDVDRTPTCRFARRDRDPDPNQVYIGVGFKRDPDTFWSRKHWGNENFIDFILSVRERRPGTRFITTGGTVDMQTIGEIANRAGGITAVFPGMRDSFKVLSRAGAFFGNDTGMAHVAASFDIPTYVMTAFPGSEVKNPPYCSRSRCRPFHDVPPSADSVAEDFIRFVWGDG